ncbi:hypothetical protein TcWFU_006325 [Taenia crassiceps]|uniref:C2H2-type domain-containing protein n=1 Tax=Taenia crassiceps TaxID=6207 RepID=A0ABR4Q9L4_9CEST
MDSSEVQDSGFGASQFSASFSELSSSRKSPLSTGTLPPNNFSTPLNTGDVPMPLEIPEQDVSEIVETTSSAASTSVALSASTSASNSIAKILKGPKHPQKKDRTCLYCGKTFDRPSLLRRHILSHTGERPFPCQYCDKAFSTRSGVNTHERTHTGQKPYVCQTCGRSFAAGSNYIFHVHIHTNTRRHRCDMCPKAFVTPGDLRRHKYSHTGDWPFRCSECNRGFAVERSLINHKSIHTGVKPYSCHVCTKSYTQESSLKTHMRLHQKDSGASTNTSNRKIPLKPFGCSDQQFIQQPETSLNEVPLSETPAQKSVSGLLNFSTQYIPILPLFPKLQLRNSSPPTDGDNKVQELQHQLSHLRVHSTTNSRSAFTDLRQQQTPASSSRQQQRPRPLSPEQSHPIDLSTKRMRR